MTDQTDTARRDRYAAAMATRDGDTWPTEYENDEADYRRRADAVMAVADAEQATLHARIAELESFSRDTDRLRRDWVVMRDRAEALDTRVQALTDGLAVDRTALLRRTEGYLSALHGSVARHDNLAANYGCAGCQLRDEIRAASSAAVAPPAVDQADLRQRIVSALDNAARTHPCPISGPYWTGCVHYDDAGRIKVGSCHSERRADAVLAVLAERGQDNGRAAVLREAADIADQLPTPDCAEMSSLSNAWDSGTYAVATELRRLADETQPAGHVYLSTGCHHGDQPFAHGLTGHEYRQGRTGILGVKQPAQCKGCGAGCVCGCHRSVEAQPEPVDDTIHACPGRWGGPDCRCFDDEPPAVEAQQGEETPASDRIVAYRSALPGALSVYCTRHTDELGDGAMPLTSNDLPDGGLCSGCGVDVLIPQGEETTS